MNARRKNLGMHAQKLDCDMLVAFEPENLFYMTGFWGEAISLLEKNGNTTIIVPDLEAQRAASESQDCNIIVASRGDGLLSILNKKIKNAKVCTDCQNYHTIISMKKSASKLKPDTVPFYNARMIKDKQEIQTLSRASKIIDEMFLLCSKKIKVGQKESELQSLLMTYAIKQELYDTGYKFTLDPLIIAGGKNGAFPHAQVTNRKFKTGDLVVVDITLRYKGYISDATRTFALGKVSLQASQAYNVVQESQRLGIKAVKPGIYCKAVDDACRNYITSNNYGKYFIHSTGHGIGLEVHEPPAVSTKSDIRLAKNMAITVEPGVYINNKFGIRIEDSLIVKDRPQVMHKFTKDLLHL